MAEREDIRSRSRRISPQVATAGEIIEKALIESGFKYSVILTEDMTPGEEEMAFFESYLKEGYPPNEAEQRAKKSADLMRKVFRY
jgi:hypothetical protein